MHQEFASPRRFTIVVAALALMAVTATMTSVAVASGRYPTMLVAGPIVMAFLVVATVRAVRTRVEVDADGGTYHGLVRTRRWSWGEVRFIGRQSTYALASTGSSPELTLRGGGHLVLVGVSDPKHPDAEDRLIATMRGLHEAYRAAHPTAAEQLAELLKGQAGDRAQAGDEVPDAEVRQVPDAAGAD